MSDLRGCGQRVQISGGGSIASSPGSMLSGCASHIFRRAMRIQGSHTLQPRSCGTVHKLPRRPDSKARPQIFRVGLLKQGKHFLCALHRVSGYDSQLIQTQLGDVPVSGVVSWV